MPFSVWDRLIHRIWGHEKYPYPESYREETWSITSAPVLWLVFLPWKTSIRFARRLGLVPKTGTVAVYELPEAFVNADPHETKRILLEVARMAETRAAEYPGYSVRVLSYSASNGIWFYLANRLPIDRFVSVVTGCNLGESLWRSRGTKHVKRICQSLGYDTHQSVDDTVREYLPENNADALPQRTSLYLGRYDEYYPIDLGLRAARAARAHNPSARVAVWPLGHFGTVLAFGVLNRLGLIRDTRK